MSDPKRMCIEPLTYLAPLLADDLDLVVADALQLAPVVPLLAHAVRLVLRPAKSNAEKN